MKNLTKDQINLRILTKLNFYEVMKLEVLPDQRKFVAPNSQSIAEANYNDSSWMRGIYLDKNPVGFILVEDPVTGEEGEGAKYNGLYFLWRFMIDQRYQGKGYGSKALDLLCEYVRSRPNSNFLYSSCIPGEYSAEKFYLHYGFQKTGEKIGNEIELRLEL